VSGDALDPDLQRIAILPMYDFEELHAAHDELWAAIAARLRTRISCFVPDTLTRGTALLPAWRDPRLLLGQTCGYPLVTELHQTVRLVLTPIYTAPGCDGAWHRSAVIVRADDHVADLEGLRGRRCALNGWDSNTGMNLLRAMVAPIARSDRFLQEIVVSGSHHQSLCLVAAGEADVASIDCVTLAHLTRIDPALTARIRILDWTAPSPGLPMITSATNDDATLEALRAAVIEVFHDPALADVRGALLLAGYEILARETYGEISRLEAQATENGYPRLA
jgi:ABC-type phosphate/phosphonate transport system substrate-binding protein